MQYRILTKSEEECFIEVTENTFRTRIEFDYTPEEDFYGIAVCCNYHFKGHPIGYLKDNGLVKKQIDGYKNRPIFTIEDTIIQAGPTLIKNEFPHKDYISEGFSAHQILKGFQCHIGKKQSGNYVLGFTKNYKFSDLCNKYHKFSPSRQAVQQ